MPTRLTPAERAKYLCARAAVQVVEDGMKLGLGTGSTAAWFVRLLADRMDREGLDVVGVPTSSRTAEQARSLDIPITTLDDAGWLDLTVDGADEFDPDLCLIKGAGGALLQEKIVATASDRMIVISDETKAVRQLGRFPLSVEVIPFGWQTTRAIIEETLEGLDVAGDVVNLRKTSDGDAYVTDESNHILDLHLGRIGDPATLATVLNQIPGVVENGLFIDIADQVFIGFASGEVHVLEPGGVATPVTFEDSLDEQAFFAEQGV